MILICLIRVSLHPLFELVKAVRRSKRTHYDSLCWRIFGIWLLHFRVYRRFLLRRRLEIFCEWALRSEVWSQMVVGVVTGRLWNHPSLVFHFRAAALILAVHTRLRTASIILLLFYQFAWWIWVIWRFWVHLPLLIGCVKFDVQRLLSKSHGLMRCQSTM
jgi:hypothetical protein